MSTQSITKRKISFFIDELATGGAQRVFLLLSKQLAKRGYDVDLVVLSSDGALFDEVDPRVNIVNLNTFWKSNCSICVGFASLFKFTRYLKQRSPDSILSTLTGVNLVAILGWMLAGRPGRLVVREATSLKNVKSKIRLALMSVFYRKSSCVVTLTSTHAAELKSALSLPECQLKVIGNPLDTGFLDSCSAGSESVSVNGYKPYFLAIGRLTIAKDFSTLIRAYALAIVSSDLPNLVIVGDGPLREDLCSLIQELSVENRVFLVGAQSFPAIWYRSACGFVLSSLWEGYPNALLEALYFGLPVALTVYDDSIKEIIKDLGVKSAEFAQSGNPSDLARALKGLSKAVAGGKVVVDSDAIINMYECLLLGGEQQNQ